MKHARELINGYLMRRSQSLVYYGGAIYAEWNKSTRRSLRKQHSLYSVYNHIYVNFLRWRQPYKASKRGTRIRINALYENKICMIFEKPVVSACWGFSQTLLKKITK